MREMSLEIDTFFSLINLMRSNGFIPSAHSLRIPIIPSITRWKTRHTFLPGESFLLDGRFFQHIIRSILIGCCLCKVHNCVFGMSHRLSFFFICHIARLFFCSSEKSINSSCLFRWSDRILKDGSQRLAWSTIVIVDQSFNETTNINCNTREKGLLIIFQHSFPSYICSSRSLLNQWVYAVFVWEMKIKIAKVFPKIWLPVENVAIVVKHRHFTPFDLCFSFVGHPSCLRYSDKLVEKIKTIRWQCLDCKRCIICSIGDDSVSLLFLLISTLSLRCSYSSVISVMQPFILNVAILHCNTFPKVILLVLIVVKMAQWNPTERKQV